MHKKEECNKFLSFTSHVEQHMEKCGVWTTLAAVVDMYGIPHHHYTLIENLPLAVIPTSGT